MSDTVILKNRKEYPVEAPDDFAVSEQSESVFPTFTAPLDKNESAVPSMAELQIQLATSSKLVDDIILKKYLHKLTDLEIIPLADDLKKISDIRLFKITEMVYQNDEYSTYKFASVFNSVQNLNCGVFIIADSNGEKTDFYMGVRSLDDKRTTKSLKDTLRNALIGQFPGVKSTDLLDPQAEAFLADIPTQNISSVSCVANNKDEDFKDNETFIQGLEKLALAMQGQKYTAIVLAKSTPPEQLDEIRRAYETIYTQLSPFANMQLSYGTNTALSISDSLSHGTTIGTSYTKNTGVSKGTSYSKGTSETQSVSKADTLGTLAKTVGSVALGALSVVAAPLTGGASLVAAGAITAGQIALGAYTPSTKTTGHSINENYTENETYNEGEAFGENESTSENKTHTEGLTSGKTENMQLTMQNKTLLNTLDRIDLQLKRLDECESLGMWECAAYFLSDSQETAEMAAGTYKALMKGSKSGVETSAINYWGRQDKAKLPILREYITNFIHPVFAYKTEQDSLSVTASSLLSSNELAIQMGLPRKSVCGFPVIEHAEFGKEVVSYGKKIKHRELNLGNIFTMGTETNTAVNLDINSLTMHAFVTGSTGSGKSNTVYEIINQLHNIYNIPFLVVEPAKGEYKNMFGQFANVSVYGTNPKKTLLLKINPFSFPDDVHILEHLDRLVEIFNVCWPMYAAMPAILKEAIERAYVTIGWDLVTSENKNGQKFPNFADVLEQIEVVINESKYSADSKGDYSGALLTRVRSLTTGLNGLIFCNDDISDEELFDKSVIVDLSRVGSTETKSLIMGLLVMKLNEYRMSSSKINSALSHITVLEEAHNLLKRTSAEQSSESSNLLGKSVELLANSIAEMRTYGEGFIIADQSPGLLDMSVIRNTNTKIVLRLPDRSDRELVGYAAGLNDEQIDELSKLRRGVAAVYQNDWVEPVLVQVNKCDLGETTYDFSATVSGMEKRNIREQLVNLLIQGRLREKLDYSILDIENGLETLALSARNTEFVEEQIAEYKENNSLELWSDENFRRLSRRLTNILGVRTKVENCVLTATNDDELTDMLKKIVLQISPEASKAKIIALSQCFMKDMSAQQDESEIRQKLYVKWVNYIKERGVR
ncbi:MAG: ATP-binding protein [Oscillospiraceae bacterium]|nr:ATP-binding protein [Oscillospiraceae bacterium]